MYLLRKIMKGNYHYVGKTKRTHSQKRDFAKHKSIKPGIKKEFEMNETRYQIQSKKQHNPEPYRNVRVCGLSILKRKDL